MKKRRISEVICFLASIIPENCEENQWGNIKNI